MIFQSADVIQWLLHYKYLVLFPIVVVEGPIATVVAGFLTSLGYLSFIVTFVVVVVADLASDCLYYAAGYWGRERFVERWGHYIGITEKRVLEIEKHFANHSGKTFAVGKLSHGIGSAVLVAGGLARVPFGQFLWYNFLPTLPKSLMLMLVGFYFGRALSQISSYFEFIGVLSAGILAIAAVLYFLYRPESRR